jgi:hypothetical protein
LEDGFLARSGATTDFVVNALAFFAVLRVLIPELVFMPSRPPTFIGVRINYRQLPLLALGKARNVMLAGGNVIFPAGTETFLNSGRESSGPSFSSLPFSCILVASRLGAIKV